MRDELPDLILGTRGSALALQQTQRVIDAVREHEPGVVVRKRVVQTSGDQRLDVPLAAFGGAGAFVKELDLLTLEGEIDGAVHSLKDFPTDHHPRLTVACVLPRGPAGDYLVSDAPLEELPEGAVVGTSSLRRRALILNARPDLQVKDLRGNVPTRVQKWEAGDYDAIVLARAGLERMGLAPPGYALDERRFPPAPGQGAIAAVAGKSTGAAATLATADHAPTRVEVEFERRVLNRLGGGCLAPLGVRCRHEGDAVEAWARLLTPDGATALEEAAEAPVDGWERAADAMADALKAAGGDAIVEESRAIYR